MKLQAHHFRQRGFTLIELMIVIAIIGIITALAVPNLLSYRKNAACSVVEADVRNAASMLMAFLSEDPAYDVGDWNPKSTNNTTITADDETLSGTPLNICDKGIFSMAFDASSSSWK